MSDLEHLLRATDPGTRRAIVELARVLGEQGQTLKALARKPQLGNSSVDDGAMRLGDVDGPHALAGDDGIRVMVPSPDGTGMAEAIALGTPDGSAWQSVDADGTVLGSMSTTGDVQAATLGVTGRTQLADGLWMQGEPFGGQSPGDGTLGPTIAGRDLIGQAAQDFISSHPGDVAGDLPWLEGVALGQYTRGTRDCSGWTYDGIDAQRHYREIGTVSWHAVGGRTYLVQAAFPSWQNTDAGTGDFGASVLKLSTDPTGRVGLDTNGRVLSGGRMYAASGGSTNPSVVMEVRCPDDVPAGQASVLMYNYVYAGRQAKHADTADAASAYLGVYDAGRRDWDNHMVPRDGQQQGGSAPPPADDPPDPTQTQFTIKRHFDAMRTFRGGGSVAPSVYDGDAAQGVCPAALQNGNLRSMITFDSVVPELNGAEVVKVEVYLYFKHWWYNSGGTAVIGTHGDLSLRGDWGNVTDRRTDLIRRSFDEPDGHYVTLPTENNDDWKSGKARGITLGFAPNDSAKYYGICTGAGLKITARK